MPGVDLTTLSPPDSLAAISFEQQNALLIAEYAERYRAQTGEAPSLALSDPAVQLIRAAAYRFTVLRSEINAALRQPFLAYAEGPALDHLAALFGVRRRNAGQADAETDGALRARIPEELRALSGAGPAAAYEALTRKFAAAADTEIKVQAYRESPGVVRIRVARLTISTGVLAIFGDTAALRVLQNYLNGETVRPLTDQVIVLNATRANLATEWALTYEPGRTDKAAIAAAAKAAADAEVLAADVGDAIYESRLLVAMQQVDGVRAAAAAPGEVFSATATPGTIYRPMFTFIEAA